MPSTEEDFSAQKRIFKVLDSELRLRLLHRLTEQPVSAPAVAEDFEVTPETIVNNLNQLEQAGFAEPTRVRGPGNRPRKEFTLADGGRGVRLEMEAVDGEYFFQFESADVRR